MTEVNDYDEFYARVEKVAGGKISALVCNAGIYREPQNVYQFSEEDFDKTIAINLKAPMLEIMHYVKYCEDLGIKGTVVVTASNRGLFGDHGPYGVSKRGIIHYVQGMARDCIQKGIRINAVAPGMTASEINHIDTSENLYTGSARNHRVLLPEEIAEVIGFLLSDESKCVVGAVVPCDEADYLR